MTHQNFRRLRAARPSAPLRTWFKQAAIQRGLYATQSVDSYGGAKARAHAFAAQAETAADWAARELHRPKNVANMGTARFAGKPYHWRQDYTGQLKLAPGESPW